ncbi:MAG: transposase [Conexivisphaerales archaeon]
MLLIASLKLLGLSYEKIGSLLKLLFGLYVTEATMFHSVMSVSSAFGPRYDELREELRKEASLHGDETSWRIKGRNHWLWAFLGRWSVIYEVAKSRGKDVPKMMLRDSIEAGEKVTSSEDRLRASADELIASYSLSREKNCRRFAKRLRRERYAIYLP